MNNQLNRIVRVGRDDYKITSYNKVSEEYPNIIRTMIETNKYPAYFKAQKILRNGNLSEKQTKTLMIFTNANIIDTTIF